VSLLRQLFPEYGDRVQFVDVLVRQAHPGNRQGAYHTYDEKVDSAREYRQVEEISWLVLVDDLEGTTHTAYGEMPDPVYLIDSNGRVAYYSMWAHGANLRRAMDELLMRGGQGGPVAGGIDRRPHLLKAYVHGWRGLRRGGWRALLDAEMSVPGMATLSFLGYQLRWLLEPVAIRTKPVPPKTRFAYALSGVFVLAVLIAWLVRRR
jgi:hypothetical protein